MTLGETHGRLRQEPDGWSRAARGIEIDAAHVPDAVYGECSELAGRSAHDSAPAVVCGDAEAQIGAIHGHLTGLLKQKRPA